MEMFFKQRTEAKINARYDEYSTSGNLPILHPTRETTIPPKSDANQDFVRFGKPDIDFFRMKVNMPLLQRIIGGLGGNFFYYHFWF